MGSRKTKWPLQQEINKGRHRKKCGIAEYRNLGEKPRKTGVPLSGVRLASAE